MRCTEAIIAYREPSTRNLRVGRYNPYFMPHEIRKAVAAQVIKHKVIFVVIPTHVMEKVYLRQEELLSQIQQHVPVDLSRPGPFITLFWETITGMKSVSRDQYAYLVGSLASKDDGVLDRLEQDMEMRKQITEGSNIPSALRYFNWGSYIPDPDDLPCFTSVEPWDGYISSYKPPGTSESFDIIGGAASFSSRGSSN